MEIKQKQINTTFSGFGLISCREDKLVLTKSPKDVSAVEGTSVTLPCKARPDDGVVYLWLRDGEFIINFN